MDGNLVSKVVSCLGLLLVLVVLERSALTSVVTSGDVDPGEAATQSDPWNVGGDLKVGDSGDGTLNVEAGGVVSNSYGHMGYTVGSTGVATVTGANSKWNNQFALYVGYSGDGTLNVEAGGVVSNVDGYIGVNTYSTDVGLDGQNI